MTGQGVSRSESEIAQKSWPSGAPARAAAACNAEMPGLTSIAISCHADRSDRSTSSKTRDAMA